MSEEYLIFRSLITAAVTGVGVVSWWGIRRLVQGQDEINTTLRQISHLIADTVSRVGQLEVWVRQRERLDDQRHAENLQVIRDLWSELRKKS